MRTERTPGVDFSTFSAARAWASISSSGAMTCRVAVSPLAPAQEAASRPAASASASARTAKNASTAARKPAVRAGTPPGGTTRSAAVPPRR